MLTPPNYIKFLSHLEVKVFFHVAKAKRLNVDIDDDEMGENVSPWMRNQIKFAMIT
jgi:hypothetical protein